MEPTVSADPTGPPARLVLVTGVPGAGKSTVAEAISRRLAAPVLAHDWAMSGLRPYPELQEALARMRGTGHRVVGWSILGALAQSQLRAGRSVVLDGVARAAEVARCREVGAAEGAAVTVVVTRCSDPDVHRARIEGRRRGIPDWYELEWAQVQRTIEGWEEPEGDLVLDTAAAWEDTERRLAQWWSR